MVDAGLSEIARFLSQHRPFSDMAPADVAEIVASAEIEFHSEGSVILTEGGEPVSWWRIIHSGAVEVTHQGKLLDLLGDGDTFGHAAMLSGLPPGIEARAVEDTLCYRIPAEVARPLLRRARGDELRTTRIDSHRPVARLMSAATVTCTPGDAVDDVARAMTELHARCAVVLRGDGTFGIVTDHDLRARVLAARLAPSAPVGAVMTAPAYTVSPDRPADQVLFEMLERGISHAPIVSSDGRLIGVIDDGDLFFTAQPRPWFGVRRAIANADDLDALTAIRGRLPRVLLELHSSALRPLELSRLLSALNDALIARALELSAEALRGERGSERQDAQRGQGALASPGVAWLALGSHARRELAPASLPRGTFVLDELPAPPWLEPARQALAGCGVRDHPVARTAGQWLSRAGSDPVALHVLIDRRRLWGTTAQGLPAAGADQRALLLEQQGVAMLEYAPPTGFDASALLDLSGSRSERFDIRRAAIAPVVALARWGALSAGTTEGSTLERLKVAAAGGVFTESEASTLADAFELAHQLRIDHQLEQIAAGREPDELLDTAALSDLTRGHLRDVFRAVSATQRRLGR